MARFKGDAHDTYEQDADFIHENTLTKTVKLPSEHFHNESSLRWTSDADLSLDSPEIEETYKTIIHRHKLSFYFYFVFKGMATNYNQSLFGYSKNKSIMYVNFSGLTTNTGIFFILPATYLFYSGIVMLKLSAVTIDKDQAEQKSQAKDGKYMGGLYLKFTNSHKFL